MLLNGKFITKNIIKRILSAKYEMLSEKANPNKLDKQKVYFVRKINQL